MAAPSLRVAYLAPEIPALSATFVYEEMRALERRGVEVVPISVHRPAQPAVGESALAARVTYLYDGSRVALVLAAVRRLSRQPGWAKALGWLAADLTACGILSRRAIKLGYQFLAAVGVSEILRRRQCAHLHVHFAHVPAQIGMYAAAMAGIPFTITGHANDIFERGLLLARKAQRAARFLTVSHFNLDHLVALGVPAERVAVVRCGVSFATPAAMPLFDQPNLFRIGTLGRLVEKKGVDVAIRALALLHWRGRNVELSVAGDGPLRGQLEALAKDLGVGAQTRFAGALGHAAVRAWMGSLHAFALACRPDANGDMDGVPVVLMEAMSQYVPAVSTRLSGIPELVIDGHTGLLAAPGDAAALANRLERLMDVPALRRTLAGAGAAHVRSEFSSDVNIDRLLEHIQQAVAGQLAAPLRVLPEAVQ